MKHRIGHHAGALFLALVAAGCGSPERPLDPAGFSVLRLTNRLGPDAFPVTAPPFGRAVATIGNDTRAVIEQPKTRTAFSALGLSPHVGALRASIAIDAPRELAPGTLTLRVQSYPGRMPAELWPQTAETMPSKRVATGFRLSTGTDGSVLVFEPAAPLDERSLYNLHLDTLLPGSTRLESLPFDLPAGATTEFEYGLTTNTEAPGFVPVHFEARLQCADGEARLLADEMLGGSENPGWRAVSSHSRAAATKCRLALSAVGRGEQPAPGAVFSVPRIVAPGNVRGASAHVNLIVISLDTLRADHLSGYGYPRATSPRIDAELIARGTTFIDVSTTYSQTDVSHMSLFSGLYGEARPDARRLHAETPVPLLAERLRDAGFETAAFTEDGLISGSFGFWWGFDRFVEFTHEEVTHGASTFDEAKRYLRANRDRRFFLFVHTYKTHSPYASADAYQRLFSDPAEWDLPEMQRGIKPKGRAVVDAYDRTIREADDRVGDLLDELAALDLEGRTIVVLLSDHGEGLTEHGPPGHSYSTFQEVVRVPLVLRGPGIPAGQRVDAPVSLVDVTPTLLELTGVAPLEVSQGISLAPALRGLALPKDRALYFSCLVKDTLGVRRGDLKYLRAGQSARFDLATDPMERQRLGPARFPDAEKLLASHREASARLRAQFLAETPTHDSPEVVSEETENALRALGYVE